MRNILRTAWAEVIGWIVITTFLFWVGYKAMQLTAHGAVLTTPVTTVVFGWDPAPSTNVVSWNFYLSGGSTLTLLGNVTTNTIAVSGINFQVPNTFGVTAVDWLGRESVLSTTVTLAFPVAPTGLKITGVR
jgi:hypothetical protein